MLNEKACQYVTGDYSCPGRSYFMSENSEVTTWKDLGKTFDPPKENFLDFQQLHWRCQDDQERSFVRVQ